jgi:hypothetical protein
MIEPLHANRDLFVTASGQFYNYRGHIDFMLFKRSLDGVAIEPIEQERIDAGSQGVTTLFMAQNIEHFNPLDYGDRFFAHIKPFAAACRAMNLYWRPVVFADAGSIMPDKGQQQTFLLRCAAEFNGEWNVLPSLCNQYQNNGVDPGIFSRPPTDNLWSRGSSTDDVEPFRPGWDYKEWDARRDYPKLLFGNTDGWFVKEGVDDSLHVLDRPMPAIMNESIGFWDHDVPGYRSSDPNLAALYGGTSGYYLRGGNFLAQEGLKCDPWTPRTAQCARRFFSDIDHVIIET